MIYERIPKNPGSDADFAYATAEIFAERAQKIEEELGIRPYDLQNPKPAAPDVVTKIASLPPTPES